MRVTIHSKITLIFTVIITVILLGLYATLHHYLREHTTQRIQATLQKETALARSFLENRHPADSLAPSSGWDQLADEIGRQLHLRTTIISGEGRVLGDSQLALSQLHTVENHYYRPEIQEARHATFGQSQRFSTTIKKEMLYLASAFGKKSSGGFIRLAIPLSEIDEIADQLKKSLGLALFLALILSLGVSGLLSLFISRPVQALSLAARDIAGGDFSQKVVLQSRDEIGELSRSIHHMAQQIKERIAEVTAHKSQLETVLLSMFDGVLVSDDKGIIILINQALRNLLHIQEDGTGKKPLEVIRHLDVQDIVDKTLQRQQDVEKREIDLRVPEEKRVLIHATPIVQEEKTTGTVLVFHDITELRRLETLRRDFVANASHELRTPVTNIRGYAETLVDSALQDQPTARKFSEVIASEARRLAQLIADLLDLSRIESDTIVLDRKPCILSEIVAQTLSQFQQTAAKKNIPIHMDIPNAIPSVMADENALSRILINLIDNAVKYTRNGGTITISANDQDTKTRPATLYPLPSKFIQITVSDTGIGIPARDLERVFERFYRVDKAHSKELGGTGLGLSIVKHLVQAMSGEAWVESEEGKGTTVSFLVPLAAD